MKKRILDGGLSVLDQGINSFSTFIIMVIVARALTPIDTGNYSIIFTTIMLLGGIQSSLITGPLRIYGVKNNLESRRNYLKSQFELQLYCSLISALILAVTLEFILNMSLQIIIASSFALIAIQIHEFVRVAYLTNLEFRPLLFIDILVHGSRVLFLLLVWFIGLASIDNIYNVIALSGVFTVLFFVRKNNITNGYSCITEIIKENWKFGRWVLIETIAFSISIHFYIYLIALILTEDQVAGFNVVQNILNIQNILIMGVTSYTITISRRKLVTEGYVAWKQFLMWSGTLLFIFTVLGVVLFSLSGSWMLGVIYGDYYSQYTYLIPILGISYPLMVLTTMISVAFRTAELPQIGLFAKMFSAVFTIAFSFILLKKWGIEGAAYGIVLTQVCWLIVYVFFILKGNLSEKRISGMVNLTELSKI